MDQTNALVPQKVSGISTAAHEAMHAAMFIYKTIECLESRGKLYLLDDVLDWTLRELTIIENEAEGSAGCFYHRHYHDYTKDANTYCCLSGFIGGYLFLGADYKKENGKRAKFVKHEGESNVCYLERELGLDMIGWLLRGDFKQFEGIKREYKTFGAEGDLDKAANLAAEIRSNEFTLESINRDAMDKSAAITNIIEKYLRNYDPRRR